LPLKINFPIFQTTSVNSVNKTLQFYIRITVRVINVTHVTPLKNPGGDCMNIYEKVRKEYQEKLSSIPDVISTINNGDKIVSGIGNGQAQGLTLELAEVIKKGNHLDLCYFNTLNLKAMHMAGPEVATKCRYQDAYASPFPRLAFAQGYGEYMCSMFSDATRQLAERYNTVMCTVAPMDNHGYFSLGFEPDYVLGVIRNTIGREMKVIVEVNEKMPNCYGDNKIHISEVDFIVEHNSDLMALPESPKPTDIDMQIADHIARLVPDGACLQLGIGGLPNAVGICLENKKDLGVHSEMICDAFLHLYEKGALTNRRKNFNPYKGIGTFAFGTQDLYDWLNMNPGLEMHGADVVNNPRVACQNDNLIAVNGIVEADLTGNCVSETINGKTYSGLGGQQDFTLAAYWSKGGKAFLATASSRKDKKGDLHSNITMKLNNITGITRWNTNFVVTEYGAVDLKGLVVPERVKAMISIAHPDFREKLTEEAKEAKLIK